MNTLKAMNLKHWAIVFAGGAAIYAEHSMTLGNLTAPDGKTWAVMILGAVGAGIAAVTKGVEGKP